MCVAVDARPGQATGTSEVATLIRTAEQISALNTENTAWPEKKRVVMMKIPFIAGPG